MCHIFVGWSVFYAPYLNSGEGLTNYFIWMYQIHQFKTFCKLQKSLRQFWRNRAYGYVWRLRRPQSGDIQKLWENQVQTEKYIGGYERYGTGKMMLQALGFKEHLCHF